MTRSILRAAHSRSALSTTQPTLISTPLALYDTPDSATWVAVVVTLPSAARVSLNGVLAYLYADTDAPLAHGIDAKPDYSVATLKLVLDGLAQQSHARALATLPGQAHDLDTATLIALERWRKTILPKRKLDEATTWRLDELMIAHHHLTFTRLLPSQLLDSAPLRLSCVVTGLDISCAAASGQYGELKALDALAKLERYRDTPRLRRALLHASHILHKLSTATSASHFMLVAGFKAALLLSLFAGPPHEPAVLDLCRTVDWDRLGIAGVNDPDAMDQIMVTGAKWMMEGGAWCCEGRSVKETVEQAASRIVNLSKGEAIGEVLARILRARMDVM